MKKLIIISVITVCLLIFMEIYCLANESGSPSKYWNYMHYTDKAVYVTGVIDGVKMCIKQLADYPPSQFTNKKNEMKFYALLKDNFNFINLFVTGDDKKTANLLKTFINVISDLYKDPANTYISIADMCIIASRKLRGEPIESSLRELRERALP